ncbi:MAG: DUF4833 domain-containing protein [Endomicrobiaceae bacterium]|nr:DUF4833 domain-containing protein [Endomicrobiaceae bacterium]
MKRIIAIAVLSIIFLLNINIYADKNVNLFFIERSKNANIVRYDAVLTDDGKINEKKPIDAYWLLYEYTNGERKELSTLDKKAYGFKVNYNKETKDFDFVLKSVKDKPMKLGLYGGEVKIIIKINDIDCFLEKVYVNSKDGAFGIPKVRYYVLFGSEVKDGNYQRQKIIVK